MTLRKMISSVVAVSAAAPLALMPAGSAGASAADTLTISTESRHQPMSRGPGRREPGRGGGRERGQAPTDPTDPSEETPEDPCPTQRWTIPVEIEGLLCLLLVESPEEEKPAP